MSMGADVLAVLPEALLLAGALVALVGGSFTPRRAQWRVRLVAVAAPLASAVAAGVGMAGPDTTAFSGTYAVDTATGVVRLVVTASTLLVIGLGVEEVSGHRQESETYALLLLSATGAVVLGGAADLLVLVVAFLLGSIPLYGLVGQARTGAAAEGAMKTYLLGALLGIVLMAGVTVLLGVGGGEAGYAGMTAALGEAPGGPVAAGAVAVLVGLMFKAGGVPGHFWVPDAAQGASVTAAAFLTTVPKVGALVAVFRLVEVMPAAVDVQLIVAVLAVPSMTLGNLAAVAQTSPWRLLGWSTVSQVGYLLLPVAVVGRTDLAEPALLFYLAAYAVTNLTAFAVVAALPGRVSIDDYRGLARSHPLLARTLLVSLLGLLGTPPTSVFAGKLLVATAAWDGGAGWLAVALVVNTLASLFYYLRWFAPVFRGGEMDGQHREPRQLGPPWWGARGVCCSPSPPVLRGRSSSFPDLVGGSQLDMAAAGLTMRAHKDPAAAKTALADATAGYVEDDDLVLIDCPPGQETLQQAALAAARWALIPVKTDASSRKGLRDVARRLEAVVDINPDLDLLGVVLFGVNRAARRVSDTARAAITDDLGSPDALFTTAIRHAEAAAQETRDRGLLAYELEEAVLAAPKWYERLRGATTGQPADGGEGPRSRSATGLAEDFQALGEEIIARISSREATAGAAATATTEGTR